MIVSNASSCCVSCAMCLFQRTMNNVGNIPVRAQTASPNMPVGSPTTCGEEFSKTSANPCQERHFGEFSSKLAAPDTPCYPLNDVFTPLPSCVHGVEGATNSGTSFY